MVATKLSKVQGASAALSTPAVKSLGGRAVLLAACALPGLASLAGAETLPEQGTISTRVIYYSQTQPNADGDNKLTVSSPAIHFSKPLDGKWLVEGTLLHDSVSGASARYHTSAASRMSDERVASDVSVTRYFERSTLGAGVAYSNEHDYKSTAVSLRGSLSSEDNNTTWNAGVGYSSDVINPSNNLVKDKKRTTVDMTLGMTQVLTPTDIAQISLTHSAGSGYFSDPYKILDKRPESRDLTAIQARWNHHFADTHSTSRVTYRYYEDTFKVTAHTLTLEWVQPLSQGWTVTPSVRYYSQTAASFYQGPPFPGSANSQPYYSADQRLGAFGAVSVGLAVTKEITKDIQLDIKVQSYHQRSSWAITKGTSQALDPMNAFNVQVGLSYKW